MEITFFGVRGSIPVPGRSTIRYGGNSVCVLVKLVDGSVIVLDAGSGMRECGKALLQKRPRVIINILHSHSHWDHVIGLPFFGPLYDREAHVRVFPLMNQEQDKLRSMKTMFGGAQFPVRAEDLPAHIEHIQADSQFGELARLRYDASPLTIRADRRASALTMRTSVRLLISPTTSFRLPAP